MERRGSLDELKQYLLHKKEQKQLLVAVEYVLKKLNEAEKEGIPFRSPEE